MKYMVLFYVCLRVFVFTNKMARPVGPDSPPIFAALQWSSSNFFHVLLVLDQHGMMLAVGIVFSLRHKAGKRLRLNGSD
jgi:hypothetical protein